jgi:hypothetical protein
MLSKLAMAVAVAIMGFCPTAAAVVIQRLLTLLLSAVEVGVAEVLEVETVGRVVVVLYVVMGILQVVQTGLSRRAGMGEVDEVSMKKMVQVAVVVVQDNVATLHLA